MNTKKIEIAYEVLSKYLLPDCLKPEYDGKRLHDILEEVFSKIDYVEQGEVLESIGDMPDHDCGTEMGDGCQVCSERIPDSHDKEDMDFSVKEADLVK